MVSFTIGSRGKLPGKTREKRRRNNSNNNNNDVLVLYRDALGIHMKAFRIDCMLLLIQKTVMVDI
jgi:hypothetical protein